MVEGDKFKPENYSLGDAVIFERVHPGDWIISQSNPDRPLEIINKTSETINFWDWEPHKLVKNFSMTSEEFNSGDYVRLVLKG